MNVHLIQVLYVSLEWLACATPTRSSKVPTRGSSILESNLGSRMDYDGLGECEWTTGRR